MFNPTLLNHIDAFKARLDRLRPLPPELVDNLREVYNIRLTYHSNAIEGNTLTQSETQIVVEKGITIGGKPLKDHLEAINHVEATAEAARKLRFYPRFGSRGTYDY